MKQRRLLTTTISGSIVTVTGGADIWISGANPVRLIVLDDTGETSILRDKISQIHVIGTKNSNTIRTLVVNGRVVDKPLWVQAGEGNDTIETGNGNDTIDAGGGNDLVHTGGGPDQVLGG